MAADFLAGPAGWQSADMYDVEGKTAVITGGASGMGRAMAWSFAGAGMSITLADIDQERLDGVVADLRAAGHQAIGVRTDVRRESEIQALADAALDEFGSVHVVCNNAGIGIGGAADEMSLDDWAWTLDVDLWSVIHGVRTFLPILKEQGEGHITATSSMAGLVCGPVLGAYHVAKHGVVALMDTVRVELKMADSDVRASVLCPGPIDTDIVHSSARHRDDDATASMTEQATKLEDRFMTNLAGELAKGMDPAEVGDLMLDAIRNERFWVLTHPDDFIPVVERRLDQIKADHAHR
ncbi:MAG: SDR family NAD(P)-dependent oxidoreductase [Actinomycetota bacterium]